MMLFLRKSCPIDYSKLCNQTVTVYHKNGDVYSQKVYDNAFLDFRKNQTVDRTGSRESNSFLLVIPGDRQSVFVGDKVMLGRGPKVSTKEEWTAHVPVKVPGLVVVSYVDTKYWNGAMVHTEAGG